MTAISPDISRERLSPFIRSRVTFLRVPTIIALLAFAVALFVTESMYGATSVGICVYSLLWYVNALGDELAVVPVIAVIASWQWLLGPFFAYHFDATTYKYFMYVDEQTYYSFVLPGLLAFLVSLQAFTPRIDLDRLIAYLRASVRISTSTIYVILAIGVVAGMIPVEIGALSFIAYLVSQTTYVSLLYMLAFRVPGRWMALAVAFGLLIYDSAQAGLFHNLLLWSALIVSYLCHEFRLSRGSKLTFIVLGLAIVLQLQGTKEQYREIIRIDPDRAGVVTLVETMLETPLAKSYDTANARLNQGWIISAVMFHVPAVTPHEYGETIYEALRDSVLPRFLAEKRRVEVSDAFRAYTGLTVADDTSFGISVLGEAWVNFGYYGIIFMAFFGAGYGYVMRGIAAISRRYPTFVLWTPMLFLQAIKMETELVVVLNHVVKSGVFVLAIYFVAYRVFRLRL